MRNTSLVRDNIEVKPGVRWIFSGLVIALWIAFGVLWLSGWQPGIYLSLILSWGLIPILIQVAFGADILLANWRLLLVAFIPPTVYLWIVDALAIRSGTWTIDPVQTTGIKAGVLPLEEMVFFLITNVIVALGVSLMLSETSKQRARQIIKSLRRYEKLSECNDHASV
jgi:putative membrane protein